MATFIEQHSHLRVTITGKSWRASNLSESPVYAGWGVERTERVLLAGHVSGLVVCGATVVDPMYTTQDWELGDHGRPDLIFEQRVMLSRSSLPIAVARTLRGWNGGEAEQLDATEGGRLDFPIVGADGQPRQVNEEVAKALTEIGETHEQFAFFQEHVATADQLAAHIDWLVGA